MSQKARVGPSLTATDNETHGGGEGNRRGGGCSCSPFIPALLYLSAAYLVPTDLEDGSFFPAVPLSGDNHLLLSVPRRQSGLCQTTKQASARGIWKIYQHFPA